MESASSTSRQPLRLWPGVAAVAMQWIAWLLVPAVAPQWGGSAILGAFLFALIIGIWWLFFSRAPWAERVGAIVVMVVAVVATSRFVHESIANGMMGFMLFVYATPALSLALVAWAVGQPRPLQRDSACVDGRRNRARLRHVYPAPHQRLTGDADSDLEWRWTKTPEQQLLDPATSQTRLRRIASPRRAWRRRLPRLPPSRRLLKSGLPDSQRHRWLAESTN